ncbi:MAG: hypothetical protein OJK14_29875, partial [Achromobacter sp.]|uniref:hypothetical protein n=1 Tax=Achromobacter sp. TaxID=134375 RepID=UPI002586AB16
MPIQKIHSPEQDHGVHACPPKQLKHAQHRTRLYRPTVRLVRPARERLASQNKDEGYGLLGLLINDSA